MKITHVKVTLVNRPPARAYVSLLFDHCFSVNDLRIIRNADGSESLVMPQRRLKKGVYVDVAAPITRDMRREIDQAVFKEYKRLTAERLSQGDGGDDL